MQTILRHIYELLTQIKLKNSLDDDYYDVVESSTNIIFENLNDISYNFSSHFEKFDEHILAILSLLDSFNISTKILIENYLKLFYDIVNNKLKYVPKSLGPTAKNDRLLEVSLDLMSQLSNKSINGVNLEEYYLNFENYNYNELKETFKFLIQLILEGLQEDQKDNEDFKIEIVLLSTAKEIAKYIDQLESFYLHCGSICEHLNRSNNNNLAIKLGRQLLASSFIDKKTEYGYYIMFNAFKGQGNINGSLLCITSCLKIIESKREEINNDLIFCIVWQSLILFTHEKLIENPFDIYDNLSKDFIINTSMKLKIDNVYFDYLYLSNSNNLPSILTDFLHNNIELIMRDDIIPWLIMIYHIDKTYKHDSDLINILLGFKAKFENILPEKVYLKRKTIIYGEEPKLVEIFVDAFLRNQQINNRKFYNSSVKSLLKIAIRLLEYGYNNSGFMEFNLAMLVKADLSDFPLNTSIISQKNLLIEQYSFENFISKYNNPDFYRILTKNNDDSNIWLGQAETGIFEMVLSKKHIFFHKLIEWDSDKYFNWLKSELSNMFFETTKKTANNLTRRYEVRFFLQEEFIQMGEKIKSSLSFAKIKAYKHGNVLLIKDIHLSAFPHNLYLNEQGDFISFASPVTDIIGIEWVINKIGLNEKLNENFSVEMWIPIEAGNMTLNQLENKLEEVVNEHGIKLIKSTFLNRPLNADINIISAHGSNSISDFPAFMIDENFFTLNIGHIISKGKILIMFVCYSGSMKPSEGKGKIDSLARGFLSKGYHAVIAPFWTLHIDLPPIWLPEFLSCLHEGYFVSEACFLANRKVYENYPTPTAWASMHIYGNPYLSL